MYRTFNIYHMYEKCWPKDKYSPDPITDLIGTTNIDGEDRFYKAYSTAEDISPWLFMDEDDLKDSLNLGHIGENEYEEAVTSLYQY